ncbi:MAG: glycoside hydrolase family 19 protein [Candidatus Xenobiia bacterium LiM19]
MGKTFQSIVDTIAKKRPVDSNDLTVNEKLSIPAGRLIPYVSMKEANADHIEVEMDYGAGTWFFYKPHTDIEKDPDASICMNQTPWSKQELQEELIKRAAVLGLTLKRQWAYMMATIQWETAGTFLPVREAFWLSEEWRKNNLRYYPFYGRGYVQLTWESNYRKYSKILNIDFVSNPDLVMQPENALQILVHGFKNGVFTGYQLEEFVNANKSDYIEARKCINGSDHATEISEIAKEWEKRM